MKTCPNCNQEVTENFEICWNCGYNFITAEIVKFEPHDESDTLSTIKCLRCNILMYYKGTYTFHEGFGTSFFSNFTKFDLFVCKECGKVELFLPK